MTKEQYERCSEAKRKNPGVGRYSLARMANVSPEQARAFLKGATPKEVKAAGCPIAVNKKGIAVKEFLHRLDYPAQIKQAVKEHCADSFIAESDFRLLSKLNPNAFRQAVNTGAFGDNQIKIDGIVYWSTANNIKTAKGMRGVI